MTKDIRLTRKHPILSARGDQLDLNMKAAMGGKPYIEARLTRHPCESEVSWSGSAGSQFAPRGVQGRKDRGFYVNYAGRIAAKLNQYTVGPHVKRDGAGKIHLRDTTATGVDIHGFWERVGMFLTAGQWCWVHVDRSAPTLDPSSGQPRPRSVAEAEASGDRVWWGVWSSTSVVDWKFDALGGVEWLITESSEYVSAGPAAPAKEMRVRTIWTKAGGVKLYIDPAKPDEVAESVPFAIPAGVVPFIPVGVPTTDPHWFDTVEHVCASILNLESCNHENLLQAVYPQMVLPSGVIDAAKDQAGSLNTQEAITIIKGLNNPIVEDAQHSGITRYITPPKSELQAIPEEILRRRKELFDVVGLALARDSKQVESAESKAFDRLDVNAVLASRARELEEAEKKAVAMSMRLDPRFAEYAPVYPQEFDVSDLSAEMEALLGLNSMDLPSGARREVKKAAITLLSRIGRIPRERVEELRAEADEADDSLGLNAFAAAPVRKPVEQEDDAEDDAG
jgi:hypothetical protein